MDSMRGLNTALPRATPQKAAGASPTPPEALLQAFKDAALSVTKLYKTAAADQAKTRAEGFQDCLDELLTFMDKEDLGLNDGEGWKIRQWATARLDGREAVVDDHSDEDERASSPAIERKPSTPCHEIQPEPTPVEVHEPISEEPEQAPQLAPLTVSTFPPTGNFSFRSDVSYPQEVEMNMGDDNNTTLTSTLVGNNGSNAVTFARANRGHSGRPRNSRHNTRSASGRQRDNTASGSKRKINFGEFFDIGDSTNPFGGGGKRSRFT